jgi:hypothetical protein
MKVWKLRLRLRLILQPMVSPSVHHGAGHPFSAHDQILVFLCLKITFLSLSCRAPSLTRRWVCSLQFNHSMVRVVHGTYNHTLLSHLRLPQLEGQFPVFISPRNRVAQLYPRHWVPFLSPLTTRRTTAEVF